MNATEQEKIKKIFKYIHKLKTESFKGWHEETKKGYLTACISIEEKIKTQFPKELS